MQHTHCSIQNVVWQTHSPTIDSVYEWKPIVIIICDITLVLMLWHWLAAANQMIIVKSVASPFINVWTFYIKIHMFQKSSQTWVIFVNIVVYIGAGIFISFSNFEYRICLLIWIFQAFQTTYLLFDTYTVCIGEFNTSLFYIH